MHEAQIISDDKQTFNLFITDEKSSVWVKLKKGQRNFLR